MFINPKKVMKMKKLNASLNYSRLMLIIGLAMLSRFIYGQVDTIKNNSQFYFPEFIEGTVKLKTGKIVERPLNYNLLSEKMTFVDKGKVFDLTNPEAVDTVYIRNKKFIFYNNVFLQVAIEGPVSLFFEHTGTAVSTGHEGPYGTKSQTTGPTSLKRLVNDANTYNLELPEEFKVVRSFVTWVKVGDEMNKVSTTKQFIKLFPGKQDILKQFIKKNRLKIDKTQDVEEMVKFVNGEMK